MVIYLDLVLILNFTVDFMLILGTNRLCGFPAGIPRAAGAATLGAIYAAGAMLRCFRFLGSGFWRIVFLMLMGIVAFGLNKSAWKRTAIFLLLSMAMGGIALGLDKGGVSALILSALSVWLLSRLGFGGTVGGREYVSIMVTEGDRNVTVIALRDTGNTLRDPVTGEQILILGPDAAKKLLDLSTDDLRRPTETMLNRPGLRLIPYTAVGQPGGLLLAKRFANVKVGEREGRALVGFAPEEIGPGQVYQALAGGSI